MRVQSVPRDWSPGLLAKGPSVAGPQPQAGSAQFAQASRASPHNGLWPIFNLQFFEDRSDVVAYCLIGNTQVGSNLSVVQSASQQVEHLVLTWCEYRKSTGTSFIWQEKLVQQLMQPVERWLPAEGNMAPAVERLKTRAWNG